MDPRNNLVRWAQSKIGTPFVWGKSDCSSVLIEGMKVYYGIILSYKPWASLKDAIRAYKEYGTPDKILEDLGFMKVKKNFEQTGDILVWQGKGYYLVGFIINGYVLVADEGKNIGLSLITSFERYVCYRKNI